MVLMLLLLPLRCQNPNPNQDDASGIVAMQAYATPNALWFVRHHHPVPIVDENEYALEPAVWINHPVPIVDENEYAIQCST
ncbi:hypothetical protein T484DRAFT_1767576 [Baffinella frigidus]|nr:hypothetical protein T484DRAFT_1767576 [Cryptophyta sp. CCMP2293]